MLGGIKKGVSVAVHTHVVSPAQVEAGKVTSGDPAGIASSFEALAGTIGSLGGYGTLALDTIDFTNRVGSLAYKLPPGVTGFGLGGANVGALLGQVESMLGAVETMVKTGVALPFELAGAAPVIAEGAAATAGGQLAELASALKTIQSMAGDIPR